MKKFNFERIAEKVDSYNFISDSARRCINAGRGYVVTAKDKVMSGWGCAEGRSAYSAVYAFDYSTASALASNLDNNKEFSRVRILKLWYFLEARISGVVTFRDSVGCAAWLGEPYRNDEKKSRETFLNDAGRAVKMALDTVEVKRPGWDRGVCGAAYDALCSLVSNYPNNYKCFTLKNALNGAEDWKTFCYGGGAIISNFDICRAYCTDAQFNRLTKNGAQDPKDPNKNEIWMDVQARGVAQGWGLLAAAIKAAGPGEKETYSHDDK